MSGKIFEVLIGRLAHDQVEPLHPELELRQFALRRQFIKCASTRRDSGTKTGKPVEFAIMVQASANRPIEGRSLGSTTGQSR